MAKEIDIDRPVGHLAQLFERLRGTLRPQGRATDRAQAPCRTHRRGKVDRANARHRSQYQRMLDAEKINYTSIGPHSRPHLAPALSCLGEYLVAVAFDDHVQPCPLARSKRK